ncbi:MAG: hypothetical protein AAF438_13540 [Pseudomonadota bacterium]
MPDTTYSLHIDYGNGTTKVFTDLNPAANPEKQGLDIFDLLDAAKDRKPGLSYNFVSAGSDRVGNQIGRVAAIDEVESSDQTQWVCLINEKQHSELRAYTPTNTFTRVGKPQVKPGDKIQFLLIHQ